MAVLADIPEEDLVRGQVGTVVQLLGNGKALVEFSDRDGREYAMTWIETSSLLRLMFEPE